MKELEKSTTMEASYTGAFSLLDRMIDFTMDYREVRLNNGPKDIEIRFHFMTPLYLPETYLNKLRGIIRGYVSFHVTRDQMDYQHRIGLATKMEEFLQDLYKEMPMELTDHGDVEDLVISLSEVHEFVEKL